MRTLQLVMLAVLALALPVLSLLAEEPKADSAATISSDNGYKWPETLAGKTLDDWIKELRSTDPSVKENVLRTIPLFGDKAAKAVPAIIDHLNPGYDVSVRVNACVALMSLKV